MLGPDAHTTKAAACEDGNRSLDTAPMQLSAADRLDKIHSLLERMLLLAQTSADPAVLDSERARYQQELDRLRGEIDRIADELD